MPLHPNVRRCTHIQITGHRCGSPALKQEYFCYFHTRMIKGVQTRVDSQIHPVALIENAEAIQAALMHMIDAVLKGTIDNKRANIVLKALHIAVRNSRNVYFHIRRDDMVREVPNYAEQYLNEHPEHNPPESREDSRLDCPAEPSSSENCHPEQARKRESKDPDSANRCEADSGNSLNPPEGNREKSTSDNTPPLTSRQTELNQELEHLEASIEGAMRGDWRDLRTVFNAIGLTPRKPPTRQRAASYQNPKSRRHPERT